MTREQAMHVVVIVLCLLMEPNPTFADDGEEVLGLIKAKIESARIREYPPEIRITDEQIRETDPERVLALLASYEGESSYSVRRIALWFAVRLAEIHPTQAIRHEVTGRLVEAVLSHSVSGAFRWLMDFKAGDFGEHSKAMIRQALVSPEDAVGGDKSVWLCGLANMQDRLPRLKELMTDESHRTRSRKWYYTTGWVARVARARMGVKDDVERCLELAETESDPTERVLRILPQIGYIRQPEAIEYLQKYLESNDRLPPTDPGMPGQPYAGIVMHILAESLRGYPVQQKPARNYTDEEIKICREWMANKANWRIIR